MTQSTEHAGRVSANPRGFGFAETDLGERYFIAPPLMKRLVPGDVITFTVEPGKVPGEFQVGTIAKLERASRTLLGELEMWEGRLLLVTDEPCFALIHVPETTSFGFVLGDVAAVRIPSSSDINAPIEGRIVQVLGDPRRAGFDCDYALAKYELPEAMSEAAVGEAEGLVSPEADPYHYMGFGWIDRRFIPFVTIDGESSRDLDDAVRARTCEEGFWVDVAISDVSAYVKPGTALEAQAAERCTSVYLPGRTVPMLPEALSSEVGSLKPLVPRLALVCRMLVNHKGEILHHRFERAVIMSKARLTYSQVYARMQGDGPLTSDGAVERSLDALTELYQVLIAARRERGVLEFNDREAKLTQRPDGEPDLLWEERNDAHRLIEEVMLLANRAAAHTMMKRNAFALYRHQAQPMPENAQELRVWLVTRGIELSQAPTLKELSGILESMKDHPDLPMIEARIRGVMQMASYDNVRPDHFSLGFDTYTHFTSPLRRYSDLHVHRLLLGRPVTQEALVQAAQRCSQKARAARAAERHVWDRIKKRMLTRDIPQGQGLACTVLYCSRRGIKVLVNDWQCTAFIPRESLEDEGFSWNADQQGWATQYLLEAGHALVAGWTSFSEDKRGCELMADLR